MKIDYSTPMTIYELLALILSAVAIAIPIGQWIWKTWIQKPILKHHLTGRANLYFNKSGSYIFIEGVFEAINKSISVKNISLAIERIKDSKKLNLQWSSFISPANQQIAGNYASSSETAHPFRIEANSIMCAFTEYADMFDSAGKAINAGYTKYVSALQSIISPDTSYADLVEQAKVLPEYSALRSTLEKEFYWEIGQYIVDILVEYDSQLATFRYEFSVNEHDYEKMYSNINDLLLMPINQAYNKQFTLPWVRVEIK